MVLLVHFIISNNSNNSNSIIIRGIYYIVDIYNNSHSITI